MGTGFSCFWRPALDGGKNRTGRPGTREKEIGFEREREREGFKKERERERYPSFQKRDAHALRFGSMNPISRVSGPGSKVGRCKGSNPALYLGKSYNLRGVPLLQE